MTRKVTTTTQPESPLPGWANAFADRLAAALRTRRQLHPHAQLDAEIRRFLRVQSAPVVERMKFDALSINPALRAVTHWCGLVAGETRSDIEATVRGDVDGKRARVPVFSAVPIAVGETERCLTRGLVFRDHAGHRVVVRVAHESSYFCRDLTVDFLFNESASTGNARVLDEFRAAVDRYDATRGKLLVFDRSGVGFLPSPRVDWDDVVLPEALRHEIRQNVVLYLEAWKRNLSSHLPPGRALLLSGPPGTGKTLLGKALATMLDDVTFLWITPAGLNHVTMLVSFTAGPASTCPPFCSSRRSI